MNLGPCFKCASPNIGSSEHFDGRVWRVWCKDCGLMLIAPTRELAEGGWNTRVSSDPAAKAEIERLKDVIRNVEWRYDGSFTTRVCKICGSTKDRGHLRWCPLYEWWSKGARITEAASSLPMWGID